MKLVRPAAEHVEGYLAALDSGWSPDNLRPASAAEQAADLRRDPAAFLALLDDRAGSGPPITLPGGRTVPRLPSFRRWMWDEDGFGGSIGMRWVPGTTDLPPHCLGHVGYAVVPWRRRRGYATSALRQLLPLAGEVGLPWIDLVTDVDNSVSQRVIIACAGVEVERFEKAAEYGGQLAIRWRIDLSPHRSKAGAG